MGDNATATHVVATLYLPWFDIFIYNKSGHVNRKSDKRSRGLIIIIWIPTVKPRDCTNITIVTSTFRVSQQLFLVNETENVAMKAK